MQRQPSLLPYHGVHEVQEGSAHQGGHVAAHGPLGRGHQQDPSVVDGAAQVDGGAALAQDSPRPLGGCVVGEARLHRGKGLGLVLGVPPAEVPGPPLQQVGVGDLLQHVLAEVVVREELQPVEDGGLPLRLHLLVGLVEGLDGLFEDGLHPRPPLLPQALRHAHHRVGGAVPVGEDAGVQQVDAGGAGLVRQVDESHPVDEGLGDVFEDAGHQVGVGVDDDDGVRVPALGLLPHLVDDEVVHEGGLAHAGAGDVEVVAAQQVFGEADGPGLARRGVSHQRPSPDALRRRQERPCTGPLHQGRLVAGSGRVPQAGDLADAQDRNMYLRVTATYEDGEGEGKTVVATSAYPVRAFLSGNSTPAFPDDFDSEMTGDQLPTAEAGDGATEGDDVGDPVEANDANNDRLTYSLEANTGDNADADVFQIDRMTGQVTVGLARQCILQVTLVRRAAIVWWYRATTASW